MPTVLARGDRAIEAVAGREAGQEGGQEREGGGDKDGERRREGRLHSTSRSSSIVHHINVGRCYVGGSSSSSTVV